MYKSAVGEYKLHLTHRHPVSDRVSPGFEITVRPGIFYVPPVRFASLLPGRKPGVFFSISFEALQDAITSRGTEGAPLRAFRELSFKTIRNRKDFKVCPRL